MDDASALGTAAFGTTIDAHRLHPPLALGVRALLATRVQGDTLAFLH